MPTLYLPIGVAGSGKSTYYKHHYPNTVYISADKVRASINNNEMPQAETEDQVWRQVQKQYHDALIKQQNVYYDNTNRSRKYRVDVVSQAKAKGYQVIAIWFIMSFKTLVQRDNQRDRHVGKQVQWTQFCTIDPPIIGIDCDEIEPVFDDQYQFDKSMDPEEFACDFMALTPQINQRWHHQLNVPETDQFHTESMHEHNLNVETMANELDHRDHQMIELAQWHDIGKVFTRTYDPMYARVHYYGHEILSSYLYAIHAMYLQQYNANAMQTSQLIRWHMQPFNGTFSKKLIRREHLTDEMINKIKQFNQIDIANSEQS